MKRIFIYSIVLAAVSTLCSCYGLDKKDLAELTPITVTVPEVIDASLGEECVVEPVIEGKTANMSYEWAFGPFTRFPTMITRTVVSDEEILRHKFTRVGQYVLRLKVDNGESIHFSYYRLNVNSGLDEGIVILCEDDQKRGSLAFIKSRTEEEIAADAQEVWPDIMADVNPNVELTKVQDMYESRYTSGGVTYSSLLVATADAEGSLYKLNPTTFELLKTFRTVSDLGTSIRSFCGENAASAAYYCLALGTNGKVYRYDLYIDDIAIRSNEYTLTKSYQGYNGANSRAFFHNDDSVIIFSSAASTVYKPAYTANAVEHQLKIVNMGMQRVTNRTNIITRSVTDPNVVALFNTSYNLTVAQQKSGWTGNISQLGGGVLPIDENSQVVVTAANTNYAYYNYGNKIYTWDIPTVVATTPPTFTPIITLPEGEEICALGVSGNHYSNSATEEAYLYVATWNPGRSGEKKGSLYIYKFLDHTLDRSYEGICDKPVKVMHKFRV